MPATNFVFAGDSNTATTYVPLQSNWAYRFASAMLQNYVNVAVPGWYADGLAGQISQVLGYLPLNIAVMAGTNNAAHAVENGLPLQDTVGAYIAAMSNFVGPIRQTGRRLFVLAPPLSRLPAVNVFLMVMRDALRLLCFQQTVEMVDLTGKMEWYANNSVFQQWFLGGLDQYHLSAVGHAYIFDLLMKSQVIR